MIRRSLLSLLSGLGLVSGAARAASQPTRSDAVLLSDADWKKRLSPSQYAVLRDEGTERAGSSALNLEKRRGRFLCAGCDLPLFDATTKFESGTGWPSFTAPVEDNVIAYVLDTSHGMQRVETLCNVCDAHLGHVFPDGPPPTGLRFCMNAAALEKVES